MNLELLGMQIITFQMSLIGIFYCVSCCIYLPIRRMHTVEDNDQFQS